MDIRDWHTCLHRVMSFNERSDNEPQCYLAANPLPVKSQGVRVHVITKFSLAQRLRVVGLARVVRTCECGSGGHADMAKSIMQSSASAPAPACGKFKTACRTPR